MSVEGGVQCSRKELRLSCVALTLLPTGEMEEAVLLAAAVERGEKVPFVPLETPAGKRRAMERRIEAAGLRTELAHITVDLANSSPSKEASCGGPGMISTPFFTPSCFQTPGPASTEYKTPTAQLHTADSASSETKGYRMSGMLLDGLRIPSFCDSPMAALASSSARCADHVQMSEAEAGELQLEPDTHVCEPAVGSDGDIELETGDVSEREGLGQGRGEELSSPRDGDHISDEQDSPKKKRKRTQEVHSANNDHTNDFHTMVAAAQEEASGAASPSYEENEGADDERREESLQTPNSKSRAMTSARNRLHMFEHEALPHQQDYADDEIFAMTSHPGGELSALERLNSVLITFNERWTRRAWIMGRAVSFGHSRWN